ncbi:uncharacterized protein LOC106462198, partial [Limulus polyphemus]|uniref:Uncharacterized protein LOC106462198 n=1 Tax=Limulus polyphemus TaxID=6850 RepID=A0ABM1B9H7_LIMPO
MKIRLRSCTTLILLALYFGFVVAMEIVDVPILGSAKRRIVSRVTSHLRLNKRQANRVTQHLKPPKEIDPIPDGPRVPMPRISPEEMTKFVEEAVKTVNERFDILEPRIFKQGAIQNPGTPAWFYAAMGKTKVAAKNYSRMAIMAEETTKLVAQKYRLSKDQITYGLPTADIRGTLLGNSCTLKVNFPCQPRKYRAFSGYCNNVQNPTWGNANTPYVRFVAPDYADGVNVPRQSVRNEFLPSAREISLMIHSDADNPHPHLTTLMTIFGEFIFHDLAHTAQSAGYQGHRLKCCEVALSEFHPECYPVRVPEKDPVFGKRGQNCIEYTRSCTAPRTGCTLGAREQINQVTSYIDGSAIYGASVYEANILRAFRKGTLKTQRGRSGHELMPGEQQTQDCRSSGGTQCFLAGDVRVNENAGLMVMHTIWVREHNRIANSLSALNLHWDDDQVYEEARRIVIAELQHITYNELLPALLGQELIDKYDLQPQASGYYTGYDININPGISNAVGTAVLSFLYSMMPSKFDRYSKDYHKLGSTPMSQTFFDPKDMYEPNKFNEYLLGLVSQRAQRRDEFISKEMTNSFFSDSKPGSGMDLAAMVIQQGRDHGIAGYTHWRKFCRLDPVIYSFNDLHSVMSVNTVDKLAHLYKHVDDIDLFTGGLAENPVTGAAVGPTFGCLLGRQFHYLRRGDRFWYENDIPPSSFTKEQLKEIRKVTLARVLCDNADKADFIQPSTMLISDPFLNAYQTCNTEDISSLDLKKWQTASPLFVVPNNLLKDSLKRGKRQAQDLKSAERESFNNNVGVADDKSPEAAHLGFLRPKRQARQISNQSTVLEFASQGFVSNILSSNQRDKEDSSGSPTNIKELMVALPNIDVQDFLDIPKVFDCDEQTLPCDHTTKFRTITGWCNNLNNPEYGKSLRIFNRLLPPSYHDDMSEPRKFGIKRAPLPSPRVISTTVHYDVSAPHVRYSLMVMQWGQFLDHDITFTPMNEGFKGSVLNCKDCDSSSKIHPECLPISIPNNDPYYPPVNLTTGQPNCISFVRSLSGQLTLGRREQLNQVTAFVDASQVYGSDKCEARMLRSFIGGGLNVTRHPLNGKDLLPQTATHKECRAPSGLCFEAGDSRASEQPALAAIHTIMMREHNRIVSYLQQINPHWSDEQLYQNGRRIVSAMIQHISYNEFLPRIVGRNFVHRYDLPLLNEGYYEGYDPTCNPTVLNEFATAAFRFGHSLIKPVLERMGHDYRVLRDPLKLRNGFFNTDMLYAAQAIDHIMRGLVTSSMETLDNTITEEVTNHLFEDKRIPFSGMDLAALNLQRGRDHGLRPYNDYREVCNLTRARTFNDLREEIPLNIIDRLRNVYEYAFYIVLPTCVWIY